MSNITMEWSSDGNFNCRQAGIIVVADQCPLNSVPIIISESQIRHLKPKDLNQLANTLFNKYGCPIFSLPPSGGKIIATIGASSSLGSEKFDDKNIRSFKELLRYKYLNILVYMQLNKSGCPLLFTSYSRRR